LHCTQLEVALSGKAAAVLRPEQGGGGFSLALRETGRPTVQVSSAQLRKRCAARDKWSLDNPGE
jgi:hypothetical protein